jgi:ferrous iron transport protein A
MPGESGTVFDVLGKGGFRRRLLDMGFVKGAPVRVIKHAPLMNPIEYSVGGTHVTLRRKEAMHILVERRDACARDDGRELRPGRNRFGRIARHFGHIGRNVGSGHGAGSGGVRRRGGSRRPGSGPGTGDGSGKGLGRGPGKGRHWWKRRSSE